MENDTGCIVTCKLSMCRAYGHMKSGEFDKMKWCIVGRHESIGRKKDWREVMMILFYRKVA